MADDLQKVLGKLHEAMAGGAPAPWGGTDGGWRGMYGGTPNIPDPGQAWPYRTQAAERVWELAKDMLPMYPELNEKQVLRMAIEKSGVSPLDLTPEDWRLLEMALEWAKNGFSGLPKPRIGGAPGGPFKNSEYGHEFAIVTGR